MDSTKRICLWSGPRNISTALMYSFAQRNDTTVVDEPLYAHYLTSGNAREYHPGSKEVIKNQENDGEKVIKEIIFGPYNSELVFFKNMTHHLVDIDWNFLSKTVNIILTRHPKDMILSYIKKISNPTMKDLGYEKQLELFFFLRELGRSPIVIESKDILKDPEKNLNRVCELLDIPFDRSMLHWKKGPRPEDGVWAKYWYQNVHSSTGFIPYKSKKDSLPRYLLPLYERSLKAYNKLSLYKSLSA